MSVRDNHDIPSVVHFFFVLSVVFADIGYDGVNTKLHFFDAFASRTSIVPDRPSGVLCLDFSGFEAFVITIVPFTDCFGQDMIGSFAVPEKQVKGFVGPLTRRDEDGA